MASKLEDLAKSTCPLCGKLLSGEESKKAEESLSMLKQEQYKEELQVGISQAKMEVAEKYNIVISDLKRRLIDAVKSRDEKEAYILEEALKPLRDELRMRDMQIERLQLKTEELTTQLKRTQSELKGEIGEINLFEILTKAFTNDRFIRQSRGISSADIVQQLRKNNGILIDSKIIFDNKNVVGIRSQDIEKMKKYMDEHKTDQAIIVSRVLPKTDVKNGYFGQKDGVLLVHPDIVVEIVGLIRRALIKISNLNADFKNQDLIQGKLFGYIRSSEFTNQVQKIYDLHKELYSIQDKEERAHNILWKDRKQLYETLKRIYLSISSSVESVLGENNTL